MSTPDYASILSAAFEASPPPARAYGCGRVYVAIADKAHRRGIAAACKKLGRMWLKAAYGTSGNVIYIGYDNATGREVAKGEHIASVLKAHGISAFMDAVGD